MPNTLSSFTLFVYLFLKNKNEKETIFKLTEKNHILIKKEDNMLYFNGNKENNLPFFKIKNTAIFKNDLKNQNTSFYRGFEDFFEDCLEII